VHEDAVLLRELCSSNMFPGNKYTCISVKKRCDKTGKTYDMCVPGKGQAKWNTLMTAACMIVLSLIRRVEGL
jgi:hypothetical protein